MGEYMSVNQLLMTKDEAAKKHCPFKVSGPFCVADKCMSWRWGTYHKSGVGKDDLDNLREEGFSVIGYEANILHATFSVRKILDKGHCGVAGLPGKIATANQ